MEIKDKKLINVLQSQGKVKEDIALSWRGLSNSEVENRLQSEEMVSAEDIARAYAALYGLPFVSLKDRQIPPEALSRVPEKLAREYKIIAYEIEKTVPETVHIAIAEPAKLTIHLQDVLAKLEKDKSFQVDLGVTTSADFQSATNQYHQPLAPAKMTPPALPKTPIPAPASAKQFKTIELDKIEIPFGVISKFPQDIAEKYQMVVFEAPHPSFIKVAVVDPDDKKLREILDFVKEKNDIAIEEYQVTPSEIKRAMRFYQPEELKIVQPPEEKPAPPPKAEIPVLEPQEKPAPPPKEKEEPEEVREEPPEHLKEVGIPQEEKPGEEIPEVKSKVSQPLVMPNENDLDKFVGETVREVQDLEEIARSGHVPKIVAAAIILAVLKKASDIHIEPAEKNIRVRFRIDGLLRDIIKLPVDIQPAIVSRIKILSKLKIDEARIPQDGRFDCIALGHGIDLRISTLPTIHGEKIAMRILDKSAHLYTLEELGLGGRALKILLNNMNKPYGVILATGPTGSGKTTTLYAILNRISNASVNIITLEDPVEYEIPGLNQCQIKPKIGFTFANGLRSVVRQDPNIIMVGEIRDSETASLATHAALTGHLVLSTLHTNDAAGALPRIIDMGVEPFFLTSLINAIIAQRLVRKLCPHCKRQAHIPAPILKEVEAEILKFNQPKPYQFFEGAGCDQCELGYKGRIGIFEVLTMSRELENLVLTHKPASELKAQAVREGMTTMKQDGIIKALKGQTTLNEVMRVITV
ncbi:MAG TPA: ATPase, T2SS/T4P/T4SS family [Patescibacteria group bacterium]|nr:ATPase, T2SS/T4P/T4SS family [Patescibacteria group bacterium]